MRKGDNLRNNKYTIWISKITYLGIILCVLGCGFLIQGIKYSYHIVKIKSSYHENEIHAGRYIDCNISKELLLGSYYSEMNGKTLFSPICGYNVYTSTSRYIMMEDTKNSYYVSLDVPDEYQDEFQKMISGTKSSIHIYGKFKKLKGEFGYEEIRNCLKLDKNDDITKFVSTQYVIEIVDLETEKKNYYKGIILLIIGMIIILSCFEKRTECFFC